MPFTKYMEHTGRNRHIDRKKNRLWFHEACNCSTSSSDMYIALIRACLDKKDWLLFTFPKTCFNFQNGFRNELSFSKCGSSSKCYLKNTIVNKNL